MKGFKDAVNVFLVPTGCMNTVRRPAGRGTSVSTATIILQYIKLLYTIEHDIIYIILHYLNIIHMMYYRLTLFYNII